MCFLNDLSHVAPMEPSTTRWSLESVTWSGSGLGSGLGLRVRVRVRVRVRARVRVRVS